MILNIACGESIAAGACLLQAICVGSWQHKSSVERHMPGFIHMNVIHHTAAVEGVVNF